MSFLALARNSSKIVSEREYENRAKDYAKVALFQALNQLQSHSGRDQVITARGDLFGENVKNPFYTLAFSTESVPSSSYARGAFLRKVEGLPRVLVSGNESFNLRGMKKYPKGYTTVNRSLGEENSVQLVRASKGEVRAPWVKLGEEGAFAYWIGDEGIKARTNLAESKEKERSSLEIVRSPLEIGGRNDNPNKSKMWTRSTRSLVESAREDVAKEWHDTTSFSASVLVDMKHGGLKKNLSAAMLLSDDQFKKEVLHEKNEKNPLFLYQRWVFPNEGGRISYANYPGVSWEVVRSFMRTGTQDLKAAGEAPKLLSHLGKEAHRMKNYWGVLRSNQNYIHPLTPRTIRRCPVVQRVQIGFDFSLENRGEKIKSGSKWQEFGLRQHVVPLVVLWNPYDVDLEIGERMEFRLYFDKSSTTGRKNSLLEVNFSEETQWCYYGLEQGELGQSLKWGKINKGKGRVFYAGSEKGNTEKSSYLSHIAFSVQKGVIEAGRSAVFALKTSKKMKRSVSNYLQKVSGSKWEKGFSLYIESGSFLINKKSWNGSSPEIKVLRYPTIGGELHTRLLVTNGPTFQYVNWNFSKAISENNVSFVPKVLKDSEALPNYGEKDANSPKFSAVLIRKHPFMRHYDEELDHLGAHNTQKAYWYQAPYLALYNPLASRFGFVAATRGSLMGKLGSPMYLQEVVIGSVASSWIMPQLSHDNFAYTGASDSSSEGVLKSIYVTHPRKESRVVSIGQLTDMNTGKWLSNYNASPTHISATDSLQPYFCIGNSFASPHIPINRTFVEVEDTLDQGKKSIQYDASWRYNESLWDRYFCSGEQSSDKFKEKEEHQIPLVSLRKLPGWSLEKHLNAHTSASQVLQKGMFNVNSTSVGAWCSILSSMKGVKVGSKDQRGKGAGFSRSFYSSQYPLHKINLNEKDSKIYNGNHFPSLTQKQVRVLAETIVRENRLRGPYSTLSQFINRSLNPELHLNKRATYANTCYEGAVQAAINKSKLNRSLPVAIKDLLKDSNAKALSAKEFQEGKINREALKYHQAYGAYGSLMQSDILRSLGHLLTVRSDTFLIRCCGRSYDNYGVERSRAFCEAIVQRVPYYNFRGNKAHEVNKKWIFTSGGGFWEEEGKLSLINKKNGRSYNIVFFKWLHRP